MGDRKARLAALAAKAGRTKEKRADEDKESNISNETKNDSLEKKTISFRNYAPRDMSMEEDNNNNNDNNNDDTQDDGEESAAKKRRLEETSGAKTTALAAALAEAQHDIAKGPGASEEAIKDLAPKKVNWDLKRDIESKLAKLERRTQRALVELLKERLDKEADEVDEEEESSELD